MMLVISLLLFILHSFLELELAFSHSQCKKIESRAYL